eukprot:TRINITY_DN9302_c0_g1_i6.p1 TRINITY_DN9302_c0_g1~~TRINITY_DN9302_c0_g1_i6.p1  ORF type:complete len:228 (+),score=48.17 TRINITY_DN9302_c0_g1_i6:158-841(+)
MTSLTATIILGQSRRSIPLPRSYSDLITSIKSLYKDSLLCPFRVYYHDLEGDRISVTSQDDFNLACTGIASANLEFTVLHDLKTSRNHLRRLPYTFTESFVDKVPETRRTCIIAEVPLEESKILGDSLQEIPSNTESNRSNKRTEEATPQGLSQSKSCCVTDLCDLRGGVNKLLQKQIREIVKKEVGSVLKREMKKYEKSTYSHRRGKKLSENDETEVDCCDKCSVF